MNSKAIRLILPDPKMPGHNQMLLWARSGSANFSGAGTGTLYNVFAKLYQNGRPAATMRAPQVRGVNLNNPVVVATGRVHVQSLTQPGAYMDADQATWRPRQNQIVATGHVYYHGAGKTPPVVTGNRLVFDTKLQSLSW